VGSDHEWRQRHRSPHRQLYALGRRLRPHHAAPREINSRPQPETGRSRDDFFSSLFTRITIWLADAQNGIENFFARAGNLGRVNTNELCVDESRTANWADD
jgi:hypothetical protein